MPNPTARMRKSGLLLDHVLLIAFNRKFSSMVLDKDSLSLPPKWNPLNHHVILVRLYANNGFNASFKIPTIKFLLSITIWKILFLVLFVLFISYL